MPTIVSLSFWPHTEHAEARRTYQLALEDMRTGHQVVHVSAQPLAASEHAKNSAWLRRQQDEHSLPGRMRVATYDPQSRSLLETFPHEGHRIDLRAVVDAGDVVYGRAHDPTHQLLDCYKLLRTRGVRTIYDQRDNWRGALEHFGPEAFDGTSRPGGRGIEEEYLAASSGLVAVSRYLRDRFPASSRRAHIPNAISLSALDLLGRDSQKVTRADPPLVVFIGTMIPITFDWEYFTSVAQACPDMTFLLLGRGRPGATAEENELTHGLPNVRALAWVSYREALSILREATAAIVPRRVNPITLGQSPLKVFDYICAGLPVVTTPLPEITGYPLVYAAPDPADAVAALRDLCRKGPSPHAVAASRAFVRANTWRHRRKEMHEFAVGCPPQAVS